MDRIMRWLGILVLSAVSIAAFSATVPAETVYVTDPRTRVRPAPQLKQKHIAILDWGQSVDRLESVGRWSRVRLAGGTDGFIYNEMIAEIEIVRELNPGDPKGEVHFTVDRYLGGPVLEAMCRDALAAQRQKVPAVGKVVIKGYYSGDYPDGPYMCLGRWSSSNGTEALEVDVPGDTPVSKEEIEIHEWLRNKFFSESRGGRPIYDVDAVWTEASETFGRSRAKLRFIYDRVRWSQWVGHDSRSGQDSEKSK